MDANCPIESHHCGRRASLLALILAAGCGGAGPQDEASVILAITNVPADVVCVQVTAASAARTVVRPLAAVGGAPLQEQLSGMPLGAVTFSAEAYGSACSAVTATTVPSWVSDPVEVSVALGKISTVNLTMHRNGRAKVGLDFPDEPACTGAGGACISAGECCSGSCSHNLCQPEPDGGAGG